MLKNGLPGGHNLKSLPQTIKRMYFQLECFISTAERWGNWDVIMFLVFYILQLIHSSMFSNLNFFQVTENNIKINIIIVDYEPEPKRTLYRSCFTKCNRKARWRTKCNKKLFSLFNTSISFKDIISIFGEEIHDYENANYCLVLITEKALPLCQLALTVLWLTSRQNRNH